MQRLNEKWLKLINYYLVLTAFIYCSIYTFFAFQQSSFFVTGKQSFAISTLPVILSFLFLIYNFVFLRFIEKTNIWLAYVVSLTCYAVISTLVVEVSLNTVGSTIFLFNNTLLLLITPAYGYSVTIFAITVVAMIYGVTIFGASRPTAIGVIGDGFSVGFRSLIAILILFRVQKYYEVEGVDDENYIDKYFVKNENVKLLTDSITDGVIIVNSNGLIKSVNNEAERIIGKSSEELLESSLYKVLDLKDSADKLIEKKTNPLFLSLNNQTSSETELVLVDSNHEEVIIEFSVSMISNQKKNNIYGALVIIRDIDAKRRQEHDKIEFISTASHEMRTPVATIEGYLALALNPETGDIDEQTRHYLEKAYDNTQHLGRLFHDLLISSHAEGGKLSSNAIVIDLAEIITERVEAHSISAKERNIGLSLIISQIDSNYKSKYLTKVDPDRIREVISNLIENAIKYSDHGNVVVRLTGDENIVQFSIQDNGVGIEQKNIDHLFQKFYRVGSYLHRSTNGTGLGLFICKKVIELYNGQIWVESKKDEGSTFFVNLPRVVESIE